MSAFALVHSTLPSDVDEAIEPLVAELATQGTVTVVQPNAHLVLAWVEPRSGPLHSLHHPSGSNEGAFALPAPVNATGQWVRAAQGDSGAAGLLRGPFVLVGWNGQHVDLTVDQLGAGRVFVASPRPGLLVAASGVATVLAHPEVDLELDWGFIGEMLANRRASLTSTGFRNVTAVPAGHVLHISPWGQRLGPWWTWPTTVDRSRTAEQWAAEVLDTTTHALDRCIPPGDVHLGLWLSGGLDSSALHGLLHATTVATLATSLQMRYPNLACDESIYQDAVVRQFPLPIVTSHPRAIDPDRDIRGWMARSRVPLVRIDPEIRDLLERSVGSGIDWHLDGGGGDELFQTGSFRLTDAIAEGQLGRARRNRRLTWTALAAQPRLLSADFEPRAITRARYRRILAPWLSDEFKASVNLAARVSDRRIGPCGAAPRRARFFGGLGGTALDQANTAAVASHYGCNFLSPFLDVDLIMLALRIPEEMRMAPGDSRYLQRFAFRDYLPPELLARRGKAVFDPRHTRDLGAPWVRDVMHDLVLERRGILDGVMVRKMWRGALDAFAADPSTPAPNTAKVWQILLADMWVRGELERRGAMTSS